MTAAISPRATARALRAAAARLSMRRRGQPLHEDRSQQLHRRRVACPIRDDLDGHAERSRARSANRCAPGPEASAGVASPRLGHGAEQRDVGEARADDRCQLLLQRGRRGVEVGVDALAERGRAQPRRADAATQSPRSRSARGRRLRRPPAAGRGRPAASRSGS